MKVAIWSAMGISIVGISLFSLFSVNINLNFHLNFPTAPVISPSIRTGPSQPMRHQYDPDGKQYLHFNDAVDPASQDEYFRRLSR